MVVAAYLCLESGISKHTFWPAAAWRGAAWRGAARAARPVYRRVISPRYCRRAPLERKAGAPRSPAVLHSAKRLCERGICTSTGKAAAASA